MPNDPPASESSFAAYAMDRPRTPPPWWRRTPTFATTGVLGIVALLVVADHFLHSESAYFLAADDYRVGVVQRGPLSITVQGIGAIRPVDERWLTAGVGGVVEEVYAAVGAEVAAGDVVARLGDPQLSQLVRQAEYRVAEERASHSLLLARTDGDQLAREAALAAAEAALEEAELRLQAETELFERQAVSEIAYEATRIREAQARKALDIERRRGAQLARTSQAERQVSEARLAAREVAFEQAAASQSALSVRAQAAGTVQELAVGLGESVMKGGKVARIADPSRLRAVVRVPESFASKLAAGQPAVARVLNVDVPAIVARVDPSVLEGSVAVDLAFEGDLPEGTRSALALRATITVAAIDDTLFVRRPSGVFDNHAVDVFVLDAETDTALRRPVQFGEGTLRHVQIVDGLEEGESVVLGNMARFDGVDALALE